MRILPVLLLLSVVASLPAYSQNNVSGVAAEWNTRESIVAMATRLGEVKPILEQLKPEQWVAKGAPEAYVQQLESTREELRGVEWSLERLAAKPEKLSLVVDAYLRVQSFRGKVTSINEAVRRYQNPAIAELLDAYFTDSAASQIQLQTYLRDLSELKEAELEVMESEAQRCRVQQIQRRPGQR
ncbi:MAG: hypothetical protein MUF01_11715 [Bryobacterales bacterium]|jgi:hypothetical protein|nr:hypothetical protein [Bryobacterales bacterium]